MKSREKWVAVLGAMFITTTIAAQNAGPAGRDAPAEGELAEVVIVGSQIRGLKVTDVLPVTVVEKKTLSRRRRFRATNCFVRSRKPVTCSFRKRVRPEI